MSAFASLAMLGVTHEASAEAVRTHGTACQTYYNLPATGLVWYVDGIRNHGSTPRYVMCPVSRNYTYTQYGPSVWVDGSLSPGAQISCAVYSVDYYTGSIAAKSFVRYNERSYYTRFSFWDAFTAAEMPPGSYGSLLCYLPPNNTGVLRGYGIWD